MSTPPRSPLEGQPTATTGPRAAEPSPPPPAVGDPKGVAEGVLSALPRSKRFPVRDARHHVDNPTPDQPGIRIYAPPVYRSHDDGARWSKRHGDTPTAAYVCACSQTRTATGARSVTALVADYDTHKDACTGAPPLTEGRTAA
ncbi:hypothetical protein [Streptomyces sp. NPDC058086]|uniref:hypothetical protein n=1 Tax=Streptomyces sp. NPDC058086 TaxID=3346334 RepID=UPI0036EC9F32